MERKAVGQRCPAAFVLRISTAWHGIEKEAQESFLPYSTIYTRPSQRGFLGMARHERSERSAIGTVLSSA
jgi:hypothetical protein